MPWKLPLITAVIQAAGPRLTKDNLTSKTTAAAVGVAIAAAAAPDAVGLPPDSLEAGLTQLALGIVALILFWYRGRNG
jgi:hypothetical protein